MDKKQIMERIAELKNEVLNAENNKDLKIEEIRNKAEEITKLNLKLQILDQEEMEDMKRLNNQDTLEAKDYNNKVFNRLIRNKANDEDYTTYNAFTGQKGDTDNLGGFLLPKTTETTIVEFKRHSTTLKDYCNVIRVNTRTGTMPLEVESNDLLANITEGEAIAASKVTFGIVEYSLKEYADLIPVSNSLLKDENSDLVGYIQSRFYKKANNTENDIILKECEKLTATEVAKADIVKGLTSVINKELNPAHLNNTTILTNQDGFDELDNLTDKNGRPLLSEMNLSGKVVKYFKGYPIEVVDNAILKTKTNKVPFYIGDFKEFLAFFEKEGTEVAVSEHALFNSNLTALRVVKRFAISQVDKKAVKAISVKLA